MVYFEVYSDFFGWSGSAPYVVKNALGYRLGRWRIRPVRRPPRSADDVFRDRRHCPPGAVLGEDAVAFDLAGVVAKQVVGSWIVTDGASRMLHFGTGKANAVHAVTIIKRYGSTHQCFVGRPNAPMMYFRK